MENTNRLHDPEARAILAAIQNQIPELDEVTLVAISPRFGTSKLEVRVVGYTGPNNEVVDKEGWFTSRLTSSLKSQLLEYYRLREQLPRMLVDEDAKGEMMDSLYPVTWADSSTLTLVAFNATAASFAHLWIVRANRAESSIDPDFSTDSMFKLIEEVTQGIIQEIQATGNNPVL